MDYQHIRYEIHDKIAVLYLDMKDKSANVLSQAMLAELEQVITELEQISGLVGLVMKSAKPSGFVFGADILEFETLTSEDEVRALQANAMRCLTKIETSHLVSVAILHGPVLGGGLELALACDWRLCQQTGRIMAGFPEANLGLMPGFAGTARGARLLGCEKALELCLSAKPMTKPQQLLDSALADALCGEDNDITLATDLIDRGKRCFTEFCDAAQWQAHITKAQDKYLQKQKPAHAPYLYAMITHFEQAGPDYKRLETGELTHFPQLMMSAVSANLRRVFALTDGLKKQARGNPDISHIEVIGAGAMGVDITCYLLSKGYNLYLSDVNETAIDNAKVKIESYLQRKLTQSAAQEAMAKCQWGVTDKTASKIDLVIEAVSEKMTLKQSIWSGLESNRRKDCLFATNSSALDLDKISQSMSMPSRLLGLHFFNPATVLPLIEIVYRPVNEETDIARLTQLALKMGKLPVKVQNSPGFLVNRALFPYIFAALEEMLAGEKADEIDEALLSFGMPMGPIELADQVGLDICLEIGHCLGMPDTVQLFLEKQIASQKLGRKTGDGIYNWDQNKASRERATYDSAKAEQLIARMLAPMISECQACLDEGHVASVDMVDAAMIYGVGFPRHTGGPLHYARAHLTS